MRKPPENVLQLPLFVRAELAMLAAFERVAEEHARLGLPIWTMREGKVVAVPAKDILEIARPEIEARWMECITTKENSVRRSKV